MGVFIIMFYGKNFPCLVSDKLSDALPRFSNKDDADPLSKHKLTDLY